MKSRKAGNFCNILFLRGHAPVFASGLKNPGIWRFSYHVLLFSERRADTKPIVLYVNT